MRIQHAIMQLAAKRDRHRRPRFKFQTWPLGTLTNIELVTIFLVNYLIGLLKVAIFATLQ